MGRPLRDLAGQRFGRLVAIQRDTKISSNGSPLWLCVCDCGNLKSVLRQTLLAKKCSVKSCGCLKAEIQHGGSQSSEYGSYRAAKCRCQNPNDPAWKNYGGRGIEFRFKSFQEFYAHIGHRPEGLTLDRIDNDGHYEVDNVRWATWEQQSNNKRKDANTTSQFKNVCWDKKKKRWRAYKDGKYIGRFRSEQAAHAAVVAHSRSISEDGIHFLLSHETFGGTQIPQS